MHHPIGNVFLRWCLQPMNDVMCLIRSACTNLLAQTCLHNRACTGMLARTCFASVWLHDCGCKCVITDWHPIDVSKSHRLRPPDFQVNDRESYFPNRFGARSGLAHLKRGGATNRLHSLSQHVNPVPGQTLGHMSQWWEVPSAGRNGFDRALMG